MLAEKMNNGDRLPLRRRRVSAKQLNLLGASGLVAYVVLSTSAAFMILGPTTHPYRELYPFFSWSLFSRVSDERKEYRVTITALDDRTFDPPIDMRRVDVFPDFDDSKSLGYKALQNLGDAISKEADDIDRKREEFADRFFGRHDVDYRISRHDYNPLERWRDGPSSDEVAPIGDFSYGGGS